METYYPLLLYGLVLLGFVITNLVLAQVAGPRKKTSVKEMPYESGMDPVGDARQPFDVKFYIVAILFLVFDIEAAFMYPWAVLYNNLSHTMGPNGPMISVFGFAEMLLFVAILVVALAYVWRKKAIGWE